MSYQDWKPELELVGTERWIQVREFKKALTALEGADFNTQEGKRSAKEILTGMLAGAKEVTESDRFPSVLCVNLDEMDWSSKITQLLESLQHREHQSNRTGQGAVSVTRPGPGTDSSDRPGASDDALHAFYQALRRCRNQLKAGDGVYSRATFEMKHGLTWRVQANP